MNTLLVAINAKFTHTNLAVRSLQNALLAANIAADFVEYTINQPLHDILADIVRREPKRLLFSCYIWNIAYVRALAEDFRLLNPQAQILLGGPEVSFDAEELLVQMPWADAIVCGEGEALLPSVLALPQPKGVYRTSGCVDLDLLPFPYRDLDALKNRVLYYESTRGCPFGCAYCLSSADMHVRERSLSLVFADLQRLIDAKVMKVKFVDRTFNLHAERATAIWRYLIEHDQGITSFQMELGGDLTTAEQLALLKTARTGLFQFEIGVQSTNEETLKRVARATDMRKLSDNVAAVKQEGNIHQHLDLIAGLPSEGFESFAHSFDDVFALRPEQLQLGFLKLLRGSRLYAQSEALGLVFSPMPPYEVLQTPALSFRELSRLKAVEEATELYYNSGRFSHEIDELALHCKSAFQAFLSLGEELLKRKVTQYEAYDLLYAFALAQGCTPERMAWLMRLDLCLHERPRKLPAHCALGATFEERKAQLNREPGLDRYTDLFPAWVVGLRGAEKKAVTFDYAKRDAWGRAKMIC
ncbi:MAG: DUF4080 domain-containing protein [Clostridia bacterium]